MTDEELTDMLDWIEATMRIIQNAVEKMRMELADEEEDDYGPG